MKPDHRRTGRSKEPAKKTGAAARKRAANAILGVIDQHHSLPEQLEDYLSQVKSARDRALVRRLSNNVMRNLPALEWRLRQLLQKPLGRKARSIHFLLLSAIDELIEQREPAPAVIHASVAAARMLGQPQLAGLVNAVLRNHQRQSERLNRNQPKTGSIEYGYPDWLINTIRQDWPKHWQNLLRAGNRAPPVWLRINPRKTSVMHVQKSLSDQQISTTYNPMFPHALRLDRPSRISDLPGYEQGWFSVQDAGAQLSIRLLDLRDGQRVLDACAAPGGKAAHMLEQADVDLTALEISTERTARIRQNLQRLDLIAKVLTADATETKSWWDHQSFDRILIDAPCSATGVMRRHPDIRWLRRSSDIKSNVRLQQQLLQSLWPLVKPGGLLVYASCSILHAENRTQARRFLDNHEDAEAVPINTDAIAAIAMEPGLQILPGSLDRDGFYYAVFRRLQPD